MSQEVRYPKELWIIMIIIRLERNFQIYLKSGIHFQDSKYLYICISSHVCDPGRNLPKSRYLFTWKVIFELNWEEF